jgi:ABC-type amino acid transport substrate-binding protein
MRHSFVVVITALISCLFTLAFVHYEQAQPATSLRESAYERVMRTGVLRCGYGVWEPAVMHDPNTGVFSGIVYDFMQEVGKSLNLKVEYSLEMPWDSIGEALNSGKIDAHCAGVFATPSRGRVMAFSEPLFFSPTVAFARADDNRFDFNLDRANQPDITAALSDDDITTEIYQRDFFRAKKIELPQFAPPEELFLALATHKADITFNGPSRLPSFEKGYPGKVKIIPTLRPLRIFPNVIAVNINDEQLLHVLNTAIDQMLDSGVMDKLVVKYHPTYDTSFLVQVNRPYTWGDSKQPKN